MSMMNRIGNSSNPFQGKFKKVLCVCSAGLLRSPTTAYVLSQAPFNYNTRAAGITEEFALIPVDDALLAWADEVVVAEAWMGRKLEDSFTGKIISLDLPDQYAYRDPKLISLITKRYTDYLNIEKVKNETHT